MCLERGPEARLALELRPRELQLVTGVLEFTLQHALLADRLASFGCARGLSGKEAEQDSVVVEEERSRIRVDDQPPLAPQVGFDRKGDRRLAGRTLDVAQGRTLIRRPDLQGRRWRPIDDPDRRRRAERDNGCRSVRDRPGRVRESDPERVRVSVDRSSKEALAEVE